MVRALRIRHALSTWPYRTDKCTISRTFRLQTHFPRLRRVHRPPPHVREVVEIVPGTRARQGQSLATATPCIRVCLPMHPLCCLQCRYVTAFSVGETHLGSQVDMGAAHAHAYMYMCQSRSIVGNPFSLLLACAACAPAVWEGLPQLLLAVPNV